ncbi:MULTISPECIES: helix-turn-helix transcriptional regulator [unclassified Bradyrhizobium]|uniref:helix-turn-helix domain-containing protein n=1 Tax=unclassified Bradyrhizobium TaxID=2631580 RepID=UPI0029162BEB|nr:MULTISPECIES: helix-turn-helix transcriptional regulator [unclassified Bradyrhizobium]
MVDQKLIIDLEVGERIRRIREQKKLHIGQVAYLAGVSVPSLRAMERGRIRVQPKLLEKLAFAMSVEISALRVRKSSYKLDATGSKPGTIRNKRQLLFYSKIVIYALEDALQSVSHRHHNHPPSELIIEDASYLDELRTLVSELKRLNDLLEAKRTKPNAAKKPTVEVKKHLNTFLSKWAATIGVGAGIMTVGAMTALLHQLGASDAIFDQIQKRLPIR